MHGETRAAPPARYTLLGVKSWTAYVWPALGNGLVILIGLYMAFQVNPLVSRTGIVLALLFAARLAYVVFWLRSHRLYCDEDGIWYYSGLLPWRKGVAGVKWRDVDEAVFHTGFFSWLFRSYTVRIGHRFTKGAEVIMTDLGHGKEIVQRINGTLQEMIRAGAIDRADPAGGR